MSYWNRRVLAKFPKGLPFAGFSDELCFIPGWRQPTLKGYHSVTAKEQGTTLSGHKLTMMLLMGPFEWGSLDMVLHRCGNPACLNPNHLYIGGYKENHRDKVLHEGARRSSAVIQDAALNAIDWVKRPRPVALSQEVSRMEAKFRGFVPDACFIADGLCSTFDGYPQLCESNYSGNIVGAHRKIYQLFVGPLDRYDILKHKCKNKRCLNPYHLVKSGRENSHDWDFKHDKRCKIPQSGYLMMDDFSISTREVAQRIGVHVQTVASYRTVKRWSNSCQISAR